MTNRQNNRLSLSTAFNISWHKEWKGLVEETLSIGFGNVELNVEVPERWMKEIEKSVNSGLIRISTLHNFCPALDPLPAGTTYFTAYLPTSDDKEDRVQFVKHVKRTVSWAAMLHARAVVLHAGEVKTETSGRSVYSHVVKFGMNNDYFRTLRDNCLIQRKKNFPRYFDLLRESLNGVLTYAADNGVTIVLENRFHINEIPNLEEVGILLKEFKGAPIGFWYDVGHAEIMRKMGVIKSSIEFLEKYNDNLAGMHLHDFRGVEDHFAPGTGEIDFSVFKPFIKDPTLLVVEAHPKSSIAEVTASMPYLTEKLL